MTRSPYNIDSFYFNDSDDGKKVYVGSEIENKSAFDNGYEKQYRVHNDKFELDDIGNLVHSVASGSYNKQPGAIDSKTPNTYLEYMGITIDKNGNEIKKESVVEETVVDCWNLNVFKGEALFSHHPNFTKNLEHKENQPDFLQ